MELLQLKYFCDAALSGNFSKTAQKYSVPSSNISQSIKRLEKEIGISLFTRYANRIELNEVGKRFYERISKALCMISDAMSEVNDNGSKINICINTNRRVVMNTVEKFQRTYPSVNIKTKLFCNPVDEEFDLIVANDDSRLTDYQTIPIICERIGVAVRRDSQLLKEGRFDFRLLKNEPFITMNDDSSLFSLTQSICREHGFTPNIAVQSDDPYYVRKCVEFGLGVAVVPTFSWKGQFHESVAIIPIEGVTRNTYVYTDKDRYLPECVEKFIEMLVEECREKGNDLV